MRGRSSDNVPKLPGAQLVLVVSPVQHGFETRTTEAGPSETKKLICFNYMGGKCKKSAGSCDYAHRPATEEERARNNKPGGRDMEGDAHGPSH